MHVGSTFGQCCSFIIPLVSSSVSSLIGKGKSKRVSWWKLAVLLWISASGLPGVFSDVSTPQCSAVGCCVCVCVCVCVRLSTPCPLLFVSVLPDEVRSLWLERSGTFPADSEGNARDPSSRVLPSPWLPSSYSVASIQQNPTTRAWPFTLNNPLAIHSKYPLAIHSK